MKKKIVLGLMLITFLGLITGCGELKSSDVTKKYVQDEFEETLTIRYGTEFVVNITSFAENSEKRETIATAYPKNDSSLLFEITGSIEDDNFSLTKVGSSYHVNDDFREVLFSQIDDELKGKYSFEIGGNADYKLVASNIRDYLKQIRVLLNDYKTGKSFEIYFEEKYNRAEIPLTLNGVDIERTFSNIIIDTKNGKVVIDTTAGGWQGELEIEEYIKLLANSQLKQKIDEILCNTNRSPFYGNYC